MSTEKGSSKGSSKNKNQAATVQEQKVVTALAVECKHPLELAITRERENEPGKWDQVCGVHGCGFVMCEVLKSKDVRSFIGPEDFGGSDFPPACTHSVFSRERRLIGPELEGIFCKDCGEMINTRPAPGQFPTETATWEDKGLESAVQQAETDLGIGVLAGTAAGVFRPDDCGGESFDPSLCRNTDCHHNGADGCEREDGAPDCEDYSLIEPGTIITADQCQDILEQGVPAGEGVVTSPFTSDAPGPDDIAGHVVATGEGAERREEFVPEEKSTSYVTREPHKISARFQELLPCPVDDEELGKLGTEMAERFGTWRKTKLDLKKFTKACKEVTDSCEARMVELEEIIQDQARMSAVDVQWEYDFTAGEKALRRCDTWEIVKRETLTVEERQLSLDLDNSSATAVEKLRQVQQAAAGAELVQVECVASVVPFLSLCAACIGDCEAHGTTHDPSTGITACTGHRSELLEDEVASRDAACKDWRRCPLVVKCFGPANLDNDCLLHFEEFQGVTLLVDPEELQALLSIVGCDVTLEMLEFQTPAELKAAEDWATAVNQQAGEFQDDGVPSMPFFLKGTQTAVPAGELVGNGYPLHPDQVGEELQAVQEEVADFIQDPEEEVDPLGAALAEEY